MKKISIFIIVVFILNFLIVGNVFAANLCKIGAYFNPSNPYQGTEFTIKISASEITSGIKGLNLILDYDSSVFDFTRTEKSDGWTISRTETQYTFFTDNHESTMNGGTLGTIILKVKDNAKEGDTTVKVSSIEVIKEDNSILKIGELEQNIIIRKNETKTEENTNNTNNLNNTNNINNTENTSNTGNANNTQNTSDTGNINNEVITNTDNTKNTAQDINTTNNADTINKESSNTSNQTNKNTSEQKNNTANNKTTKTKTAKKKSKKDLPYTGNSIVFDSIILLGIAIFTIISYKSFIKYKNM